MAKNEVRWPADSRLHAWALPGMVAHTHGRQHVAWWPAVSRSYAWALARMVAPTHSMLWGLYTIGKWIRTTSGYLTGVVKEFSIV